TTTNPSSLCPLQKRRGAMFTWCLKRVCLALGTSYATAPTEYGPTHIAQLVTCGSIAQLSKHHGHRVNLTCTARTKLFSSQRAGPLLGKLSRPVPLSLLIRRQSTDLVWRKAELPLPTFERAIPWFA